VKFNEFTLSNVYTNSAKCRFAPPEMLSTKSACQNAVIFHAADKLPELIFIIGSIAPKILSLDARVGNRVVLETAGHRRALCERSGEWMDGRMDAGREAHACETIISRPTDVTLRLTLRSFSRHALSIHMLFYYLVPRRAH
jgi:hypothetical protein